MDNKKVILWLALLQGFAMLLVVVGHVGLNNEPLDPLHPAVNVITQVIFSFHMPLFMVISGFLFYQTRMKVRRSYRLVMVDKLKRLYVPMLFFTVIIFFLKIAAQGLVKHPVDFSPQYLSDVFIFYRVTPFALTWFLITLLILMSLYPLYFFVLKRKTYQLLFFAFALILASSGINIDYFQLDNVTYMLLFFYSGILMSRYEWQQKLSSKGALIITTVAFAAFNYLLYDVYTNNIPAKIFVAYLGVMFAFSLCMNIAKILPNLFSSFRDCTYQIFLMGVFFQLAVRYVYAAMPNLMPFWCYYALSILLGLYIPVLITMALRRIGNKYLNLCVGIR